jgi:rRNA-processing protein FCF1
VQSGCIDSFLEFVNTPDGLSNLRKITGASSVIATAFVRTNRDPIKLRQWIMGDLKRHGEILLPDIKDIWVELDVITNLLRYYYAFFQKQFYPVLIADHCEILFDNLITYINDDERVNMVKFLSSIMDLSSFFISINSEKVDSFKRVLYPKSATYDTLEVPPMQRKDIAEFIGDVRKIFVDSTRTETLSETKDSEHLTSESYPLTLEAEEYLSNLFPLEPGKLVRILQSALDKAVQERKEYFISKKDIEETIREIFPTLFFKCNFCKNRLISLTMEMNIPIVGRPTTIRKILCPYCRAELGYLGNYIPNILDQIVLDSSSLANLDFSALCTRFPELLAQRIKVFIPSAVLSEISAWDKKEEKRGICRLARQEYQKLIGLDSTGKIQLLSGVGRNPTIAEIKEATSFNSIDRIIIDIAELHNATLLTRDQDMATNSLKKARFTILFKVA